MLNPTQRRKETTTMNNNPFINPYPAAGKGLTTRLNVNIATEEFLAVKRVLPQHGLTQILIGTLFKKFYERCRLLGLLDYSRVDDFKQFILSCDIVAGGGPSPDRPSNPSTPGRTDVEVNHGATKAESFSPPTTPQAAKRAKVRT